MQTKQVLCWSPVFLPKTSREFRWAHASRAPVSLAVTHEHRGWTPIPSCPRETRRLTRSGWRGRCCVPAGWRGGEGQCMQFLSGTQSGSHGNKAQEMCVCVCVCVYVYTTIGTLPPASLKVKIWWGSRHRWGEKKLQCTWKWYKVSSTVCAHTHTHICPHTHTP